MKERPILFSGPMVRAILEGRKTQTRRVVKPQPPAEAVDAGCMWAPSKPYNGEWSWLTSKTLDEARIVGDDFRCPYGVPGDRLWVRETWCRKYAENGPVYNAEGNLDPSCYWYRATTPDVTNADDLEASPWRPSIHMPRHACRLTLEVVAVRVERLQAISEEDAKAEGPERNIFEGHEADWDEDMGYLAYCRHYPHGCECFPNMDARDWYKDYWDHLNGKGAWDANPWVWVVEFKRIGGAS